MPSPTNVIPNETVHVAIGVIHFAHYYLLGFRHAKQHQGNRYEFIGGKVERLETPRQALVREVAEEIGLVIQQDNGVNRLGVLQHSYVSEQATSTEQAGTNEQTATTQQSTIVCLHVYRITLTEDQYHNLSTLQQGCEQQPLKWVTQQHLVENRYELPEANATILQWLKLADVITVTYELGHPVIATCPTNTRIAEPRLTKASHIRTAKAKQNSHLDDTEDNLQNNTQNSSVDNRQDNKQHSNERNTVCQNIEDWVEFQRLYLPKNGCVYVRLKTLAIRDEVQAIMQLTQHRPDLCLIISARAAVALSQLKIKPPAKSPTSNNSTCELLKPLPKQIIAQHLTQANFDKIDIQDEQILLPPQWHPTLPLTLSCHEERSIQQANKLAQTRLTSKQLPVIALFLSPVMSTRSHPDATPLGWRNFNHLANHSKVPVIALGGLTPDDLITARLHGADKIAGIRQFYQSPESHKRQ